LLDRVNTLKLASIERRLAFRSHRADKLSSE